MPTLIRWWEALSAPDVAKWQLKYRVDWDAREGRNGGTLMEMERFDEKQGAVALVLDSAKAFERTQWGWPPTRILNIEEADGGSSG